MDALLAGTLAYEDFEGDPLVVTLTGGKIYAERTEHDYKLAIAERRVVDFGSVANATMLVIHKLDNAVDLYLNGSLTAVPLSANGTILLMISAITSLEIEATVETRVSVVLLGD